jgi:hypothetical protein
MANPQKMILPEIGTGRDFARASGYGETTIYKHLSLGNLESARFGNYRLITRNQFETWHANFKPQPGRPRKN